MATKAEAGLQKWSVKQLDSWLSHYNGGYVELTLISRGVSETVYGYLDVQPKSIYYPHRYTITALVDYSEKLYANGITLFLNSAASITYDEKSRGREPMAKVSVAYKGQTAEIVVHDTDLYRPANGSRNGAGRNGKTVRKRSGVRTVKRE